MKTRNRSSVSSKLAEISALQNRLQTLQTEATTEINNNLRALPAQFGFADVNTFIRAVRNAHKDAKPAGRKTRKVKKARKAKNGARKARASITPEKRALIIADLTAKMPGLDVASKHGISLATVQNIKKAAGLVTERA
jgi:hypothetical protein